MVIILSLMPSVFFWLFFERHIFLRKVSFLREGFCKGFVGKLKGKEKSSTSDYAIVTEQKKIGEEK